MKKKSKELELAAIKNYLLPYLNLEKQHPYLPGAKTISGHAAFIGIESEELSKLRNSFKKTVKDAALDLLKEQEILDGLEQIPFSKDDTIMVIGDSLTDDLQGWFEILRYLLEIGVDDANFRILNQAVYDSTSLDALRRADRDLALHQPDWVIVALGSLDAQRLHATGTRTLVSLADFYENISSIESMVSEVTKNPIIWVTPPPPLTELMEDMPLFSGIIKEDDLSQYRQIIAGKNGYISDPFGKRFGSPEVDAWHYLPDGFHPSLAGHIQTVKWFLRMF
ncbi:MAG: SGNH/GDSL hydrolase family protein [Bacteroidetes bacterium]|nr:SGNH/GDSL hydrolase family protein [Bacteroidota bacterium]MCH8524122.1 SGNH/GDSL hydrolase family protein [Balneolales bacterium]